MRPPKTFLSLIISLYLLGNAAQLNLVMALYDPLNVPNNKFGIHIADVNDISSAADLVNSSGGDWGYVTVVIPDNDRNVGKWQEIFNSMRRKHLIPLIRLATRVENSVWLRPTAESAVEWVSFLTNLNWPTENRYVILFNEPNHAKEWGGTINPTEYATVATELARSLKKASEDFFILPAAMDVSAVSDGQTLDAAEYLSEIYRTEPDFFEIIDGWNSHSYPNPGFSGSPLSQGRGSLSSFRWEQSYIRSLGINKSYPVFITETGWQHSEGKEYIRNLLDAAEVARYIQTAAAGIWSDERIVAVTPFILNYQDVPFDHFSMKKIGQDSFYAHHQAYMDIPKIPGKPRQKEFYSTISELLPDTMVSRSVYTLSTEIKNIGQGIAGINSGYMLELENPNKDIHIVSFDLPDLEPGEQKKILLNLKTGDSTGSRQISIFLRHNDAVYMLERKTVSIIPPPSLLVRLNHKSKSAITDTAEVTLYDANNKPFKIFSGLTVRDNNINIDSLYDILPGKEYVLRVIVRGYLPRTVKFIPNRNRTLVIVPQLLPFDLNYSGRADWGDFGKLFADPFNSMKFIFGL